MGLVVVMMWERQTAGWGGVGRTIPAAGFGERAEGSRCDYNKESRDAIRGSGWEQGWI